MIFHQYIPSWIEVGDDFVYDIEIDSLAELQEKVYYVKNFMVSEELQFTHLAYQHIGNIRPQRTLIFAVCENHSGTVLGWIDGLEDPSILGVERLPFDA